MPNISELIDEVEKKWLKAFYSFVTDLFRTTFIPSHNQTHHLRTWQNAKIILSHLAKEKSNFNIQQIEEVLIASFFHDTGLTLTLDEKHGKEGVIICQNYFRDKGINLPGLNSILEAIEFHENKVFSVKGASPYSLKIIISTADDMDAFGLIGIYRYTEIYLIREISANDLGAKVLQNLESRFKNIELNYADFPLFLNEVSIIYDQTKCFYENLKVEKSKEMHIIDFIKKELVDKRQEFNKNILARESFSDKEDSIQFFRELADSLQNADI